jgi:hypothetical protein
MLRELQLIDDTDSGRFHVLSINTVVQLNVNTVRKSNKNSRRALGTPVGPLLHILAVGPEARGIIFIIYRITNFHAHLFERGGGGVNIRESVRVTVSFLLTLLSQLAGQCTGELQLPR